MRTTRSTLLLVVLAACSRGEPTPAVVVDSGPLPQWTGYVSRSVAAALGDSGSVIEGLAAHDGKLYTVDWKDGAIYRLTPDNASPSPLLSVERVGELGTKPGTVILGVVADGDGNLYAAAPETGTIYKVMGATLGASGFDTKRAVSVFATGAAGANGLAFDRTGQLWITGGDRNALYRVGPTGGKVVEFAKGYATISPDTTMPVRIYVTNGIAFDSKGNVYTANTGTGEIQRIEVRPDYTPGAITTFVKDTLLLGADGLIMDENDNLFVTANYNNSLFRVTPDGTLELVTSDKAGMGRNEAGVRLAPSGERMGSSEVFRFPAELKKVGNTIYVANLNFKVGANAEQSFTGASVAGIRVK
jgi:sugar lactone lactonase YvrE